MASNIGTLAAFATANMRPASGGGENIDAIWGDNICDNTGYVYFREQPTANISMAFIFGTVAAQTLGTMAQATTYFTHFQEYGTLNGSYVIYCYGSVANAGLSPGTVNATFFVNATQVYGTKMVFTGAGGVTFNGTATGSFIYNKTALTHNTKYPFSFFMSSDNTSGGLVFQQTVNVTTWQHY